MAPGAPWQWPSPFPPAAVTAAEAGAGLRGEGEGLAAGRRAVGEAGPVAGPEEDPGGADRGAGEAGRPPAAAGARSARP